MSNIIKTEQKKNSVVKVELEDCKQILDEIFDAYQEIPFDNSSFQIENFVIGSQITPQRAYRTIGLTLINKLTALQNYEIEKRRNQIKIEELNDKINNPKFNKFQKQNFELDLLKIKINSRMSEKLIKDAMIDLTILYNHFKKLPKYTREQFEIAEKEYYTEKLQREMSNISGAKEALINMNRDIQSIQNYENNYMDLLENMEDKISSEMLDDLSKKSLTNISRIE